MYMDAYKTGEGDLGALMLTADKYGTVDVKSNIHPLILPPPEWVRTGDILFCFSFEIISYNRWVLFHEPASQNAPAPRASMAPKTPRATQRVQLPAQLPPKSCAGGLFIELFRYFLVKHQWEPVFHFLCSSWVFPPSWWTKGGCDRLQLQRQVGKQTKRYPLDVVSSHRNSAHSDRPLPSWWHWQDDLKFMFSWV